MKKIFILCLLFVTVYTSQTKQTHATLPTIDYVNLGQAFVDYIVQGYQYAEEKVTSSATVTGSAQQTLQTVNDKVLIPARDTLTVVAMAKSGKMMQNLVLGELGVDPLLVRNPDEWIQGRKEEIVKGVLEDPEVQNSIYSASIMGAVIDQAKNESDDLSAKIKNINYSPRTAIEQESRCTDEALSKQAKEDVQGTDGQYLQEDFVARKKQISDALCGDISDPDTKKAVEAVAEADREVNWGNWLALTGGDNEYTKQQRTLQQIEEEKTKEEEKRKAELAAGGGVKNDEKCVEYTIPGDTTSPCKKYEVARTGNLLNDSFKQSISNPAQLQLAGFGKGAGNLISTAASVIGTAFTTYSLLEGVGKDIGASSAKKTTGTQTGPTSNNTVVTSTATTKDLTGNPQAKKNVSSSPLEQLQSHKDNLAKLSSLDVKYLEEIDTQKNNLDQVKGCFTYLETNYGAQFPDLIDDKRFIAGLDFYTDRINANRLLYTQISNEKKSIAVGSSLINNIISQINASQSSEEILNLFLGYESKLKEQNIPDSSALMIREGDYVRFKQTSDQETKGNTTEGVSTGGDIFNQRKNCDDMRKELELKSAQGQNGGSSNPGNSGGTGGI